VLFSRRGKLDGKEEYDTWEISVIRFLKSAQTILNRGIIYVISFFRENGNPFGVNTVCTVSRIST
jgi:hypothetical protein